MNTPKLSRRLESTLVLGAVAAALIGASTELRAAPSTTPSTPSHEEEEDASAQAPDAPIELAARGPADAAEFGEPGKAAKAVEPWSWGGVYKVDLLRDARNGGSAVGTLGLRLSADAAALWGWEDTTLRAELLWAAGSKPNQALDTTQGVSNLEVATNGVRWYSTWIEHEFKASNTSALFGLYDLNSEFYTTEASGLLIHPSFGIGVDLAQSGRNGPSIFPNLGLGLRVRQQLGGGLYLQAAVLDAVPGDPDRPERTSLHLSADEGALYAAEFGWQQRDDEGATQAGHWSIGAWRYSKPSERIDGEGLQHNQGVYALVQGVLVEGERARTIGFLRTGAANQRVNAVDVSMSTGVLIEKPFGEQGPAAFTAGVAYARYGKPLRQAEADAGNSLASHETALELGLRWQVTPALALQPVLQHVWHPGGRADATETIAGLRLELAFGSQ